MVKRYILNSIIKSGIYKVPKISTNAPINYAEKYKLLNSRTYFLNIFNSKKDKDVTKKDKQELKDKNKKNNDKDDDDDDDNDDPDGGYKIPVINDILRGIKKQTQTN